MKYVDEFRDGELARRIAARIHAAVQPDRDYRFMEFCGGHTHAIVRGFVTSALPGWRGRRLLGKLKSVRA